MWAFRELTAEGICTSQMHLRHIYLQHPSKVGWIWAWLFGCWFGFGPGDVGDSQVSWTLYSPGLASSSHPTENLLSWWKKVLFSPGGVLWYSCSTDESENCPGVKFLISCLFGLQGRFEARSQGFFWFCRSAKREVGRFCFMGWCLR